MDPEDGFPQSRNFPVLTHVIFTRTNKLEAKSREHVKVERRSTFTFKCYLSCTASIIFCARKIYVRTAHGKIKRQWKSNLTLKRYAFSTFIQRLWRKRI